MKTTHTPGPWEITLDARNALGFIRPATPELATPIATIHYADSGASDANAHLIAAAPDLLAALQNLIAWREEIMRTVPNTNLAKAIRAADSAIAKAEGAQS